jgi:flagellar biosynthetic protein FliR
VPDLTNWLFVFLRASGFLALFPVFSATNFPVITRVALGALLALFVSQTLPATPLAHADLWGLTGGMTMELGVGLLLGFVSRLLWYALDIAGGIIAQEVGLATPSSINPMSSGQTTEAATLLHYLAAMLFLTLNLHHQLLAAFGRSYHFLPIGGARLHESLLLDVVSRTSHLFLFALQVSAPIIAVSFLILLVFSVLGRAVPQMNVFFESFAMRILAGMTAIGLTFHLMGQHIANYLNRLPEDFLRVAYLCGLRS